MRVEQMEQIINYRDIPTDKRIDILNALERIGFFPAYGLSLIHISENYRQSHEAEFIIYEAALRQLKVLAPGKKLPLYCLNGKAWKK